MTCADLFQLLPWCVVRGDGLHEGGRPFISTMFKYPNGDLVSVSVEEDGGNVVLSDNGMTLYSLSVAGVVSTQVTDDVINGICALHGASLDGASLKVVVKAGSNPHENRELAVLGFMDLCQVICKVSTLELTK
jgi:hypothetical protein